ncbi:c-type cytochrome [Phenylobacterium sp.]|uniref:c-type cytochrome n=1 Tax=Phenylobacterium sp. TaxID=1871053 RepID=UPI0035ADD759
MRRRLVPLVAVAAGLASGPALAADGGKLFALQCKSCHGAASTLMGPALNGVTGAKIAVRGDYKFSEALKAKGGTWTAKSLDAYLANPQGFAPGGRMKTGVADPAARQAIVAYLETLK